ncbi:NADH-cytochrome reductase [Schizosaccharomyces octosporus yFS286]|uniref:NADH-cytochrome reductase n=1 Tax=Schizosaccharomyces octosporus (strain yFS286) TaxID=483514 RepID=S9QW49_SCHOY|nr:NADH-cytochrome reductase [Schizosaccharomyces octosporus yFS286]EPX70540.1 NADH-cytochrome reductase [Schizosaccharomyces octosporus yFS286]
MSFSYKNFSKFLLGGLSVGCVGGYFAYKNQNKPIGLNTEVYSPFTISQITKVTPDASIFTLTPQGSLENMKNMDPISKVTIRNPDMQVQRPYTPLYINEDNFKFYIRNYEDGPVSSHIHSKKEGDTVELRGPFKTTKLDHTKFSRIVGVVAGTGIAPIYQLAQNSKVPVDIVYCERPGQEPALKEQLEKECPNVRVRTIQDRLIAADDILKWDGVDVPLSETLCIICGNPKFVATVAGPKAEFGAKQGPVKGLLEDSSFGKVWKL